jgi:hypothetical protein
MDDSKVKRIVCTRLLEADGVTQKSVHLRVVELGDYDDAQGRIRDLEAKLSQYGDHRLGCAINYFSVTDPQPRRACDCGFSDEMSPMRATPPKLELIKRLHAEFEVMGMQCADWGVMAHEHRAHLIKWVEEQAATLHRAYNAFENITVAESLDDANAQAHREIAFIEADAAQRG